MLFLFAREWERGKRGEVQAWAHPTFSRSAGVITATDVTAELVKFSYILKVVQELNPSTSAREANANATGRERVLSRDGPRTQIKLNFPRCITRATSARGCKRKRVLPEIEKEKARQRREASLPKEGQKGFQASVTPTLGGHKDETLSPILGERFEEKGEADDLAAQKAGIGRESLRK